MKKADRHSVLLAELSMTGVFHAEVNTGLIRLMQEVYPDAGLRFHAEKSHIAACRKQLAGGLVDFHKFPVFPPAQKFTLPIRDLLGCIYSVCLFLRSRKADVLVITNLLPLTHWCVWLLNGLFRRHLFIVLHGQLEALLPDTPLRGTKHYFRLHKHLFLNDTKNRYVFLGQTVYDAAKELFTEKTRAVIIDHPYDYKEEKSTSGLVFPLRFGQIGVGNRGKGTEKLFQLGELLQQEIQAGQVELCLIGRLDPELRSKANHWVKWYTHPLTASEFSQKIKELHFALLLRDAGCGRTVPSGSFFDAVKYGKPFLSLAHAFVRHYAETFPGCGDVFSSVEEMAETIRRICRDRDHTGYQSQVAILREVRSSLSIPYIAEQFKHQLS